MAKRNRGKSRMTAEEIEAQRVAAHEEVRTVDNHPDEIFDPTETMNTEEYVASLTHEQALQGSYLGSGVDIHDDGSEEEASVERRSQAKYEELIGATAEPVEENEDEIPEVKSIVAEKFKLKYIENAKNLGVGGKAAKRSNWDWLSQQIAATCLGEKEKIRIADFIQLLEVNGVDHSRWTNRNKGWEGRFRMTGRVALQKVVANSGVLKLPDGAELKAPEEWCSRYKTKD